MVDDLQSWDGPDGSTVTGQLVVANRLWNVTFTEESSEERSLCFRISVALQQDIEHDSVLVHSP